jgi:hypothetical protein
MLHRGGKSYTRDNACQAKKILCLLNGKHGLMSIDELGSRWTCQLWRIRSQLRCLCLVRQSREII